MNIFDFIRRIEALEAERAALKADLNHVINTRQQLSEAYGNLRAEHSALLAEVAPLRELRAAGIEPADILWDHRHNPISLTLIFYGVGDDCAKSIARPLNRCLFGQP